MKVWEIPLGSIVEMNITRGGKSKVFKTKVENNENKTLQVLVPITLLGEVLLKKADKINLTYKTEKGLLLWNCVFDSKCESDGTPVINLKSEEDGEKYNRRKGFRVVCSEVLKYTYNGETIQGRVTDISVMGICFETLQKHKELDTLMVEFSIEGIFYTGPIQIVRVAESIDGINTYGAKFLLKPTTNIEKIVNLLQLKELRVCRNRR